MFQQIVVVFSTADDNGNDGNGSSGTATALRLVQSIFVQCRDVPLLDTSPFGEKRWSQLQLRLEHLLQPIDEQIAALVRQRQRAHAAGNARQLVHSFAGHGAILRREAVMKLLTVEREQFADAVQQLIKEARIGVQKVAAEGGNVSGDLVADGALNLSPVCTECQWLKMYEQQMTEITNALPLLVGHVHYELISRSVAEVQEETAKQLVESFALWRDQSLAAVQSGELR